MNEPIYQAWRPIQPVEGGPIPEGAEFRSAVHGCVNWGPCRSDGRFASVDAHFEWRVPVPVIMEDVAVDAIMQNAFEVNGDNYWTVEIDGQREYRAATKEQLRETVIAKLRELSQGESCN